MRVNASLNANSAVRLNNFNFGRALPTSKKEDYSNTAKQAKEILGIDDGVSILKIHSGSMPKQNGFDTGIGKLNSTPAIDFVDKMCFYTDTNAIKEFPMGQTTKNWAHFNCPYLKTATTFGEENINLLNLVNMNLLQKEDIEEFNLNSNKKRIEYENELGTDENYPILKPLKKAYENFKINAPEDLKEEFERFKEKDLVQNTYTRLALYPYIAKDEPDLFEGFDTSLKKQEKFAKYKEEYKDEIDFFKFRQFLAKKEHDSAKEKINAKGKDLFGDCLIGFSNQEVWAHPDAFEKGACIGLYNWGLPALDFDTILDENSESHKVFNDKISFFLENYDGIRFDVGWCYAIAQTGQKDKDPKHFDLGHNLFDFIEQRAMEIKGKDFNTQKLIYEMDGFEKMFDWQQSPPKPIPNVKNIVNVLTTEWQHNDGEGWGSPEFFKKTGLGDNELIMGTNNHDGMPLRALAENNDKKTIEKRKNNAEILSKLFNMDADTLIHNPQEFVKAKFAQLYTTKNQFLYFTDVLGSKRDMDDQTTNVENYRFRVNKDFERQYHTALQKGRGFNLMESLKLAMESKGLDKNNPEIYSKVSYYADYLRAQGAKTEQEANREERKQEKASKSFDYTA